MTTSFPTRRSTDLMLTCRSVTLERTCAMRFVIEMVESSRMAGIDDSLSSVESDCASSLENARPAADLTRSSHVSTPGIAGNIWKSPVCHRSEEHTSELQSLMRISYAVFCLK